MLTVVEGLSLELCDYSCEKVQLGEYVQYTAILCCKGKSQNVIAEKPNDHCLYRTRDYILAIDCFIIVNFKLTELKNFCSSSEDFSFLFLPVVAACNDSHAP